MSPNATPAVVPRHRPSERIAPQRLVVAITAREAPLNLAHLRNMIAVTEMGGVVFPPVPAFYLRAGSIDALVKHMVHRVLDLFDVHSSRLERWEGLKADTARPSAGTGTAAIDPPSSV